MQQEKSKPQYRPSPRLPRILSSLSAQQHLISHLTPTPPPCLCLPFTVSDHIPVRAYARSHHPIGLPLHLPLPPGHPPSHRRLGSGRGKGRAAVLVCSGQGEGGLVGLRIAYLHAIFHGLDGLPTLPYLPCLALGRQRWARMGKDGQERQLSSGDGKSSEANPSPAPAVCGSGASASNIHPSPPVSTPQAHSRNSFTHSLTLLPIHTSQLSLTQPLGCLLACLLTRPSSLSVLFVDTDVSIPFPFLH